MYEEEFFVWLYVLQYLLITLPFAIFAFVLARRKGKTGPAFAVLALIPYVNVISLLYLASLPDAGLLARIRELEKYIGATSETAS